MYGSDNDCKLCQHGVDGDCDVPILSAYDSGDNGSDEDSDVQVMPA